MASSRDERDLSRTWRQVGIFTSIPLLLAAGPLVGFVIGRFLDRQFQTPPWGLIGAILLGLAAAIRETIRLIRQAIHENTDAA